MPCPCDNKDGIELAICIAPPPGDYDVEIEISPKYSIVVNSEGIHVKQTVLEDTLPFTRTVTRKVGPEFLERVIIKIPKDKLPCIAARALVDAAENGSEVAREKLNRCRKLVDELARQC
ncbi:MAG: hypothetical protein F7C38_03735 [Desulfurococcales archaeon]|nr:hypothetical protein [Desulfurococcales archaeon]